MKIKNLSLKTIWTSTEGIRPGKEATVSDEEGSFLCDYRSGELVEINEPTKEVAHQKEPSESPTCPHCGKILTNRNKRWHLDACKEKK